MKTTSQTTEYILLKAYTNSDWDECHFALIHYSKEWKETLEQRLKTLQFVENEYGFSTINYYDTSVDFYRANEEEEINDLLQDKNWAFVELKDGEQETFLSPENCLDTYHLRIYRHGIAMFSAYGKHTGEEFWTEDFSIPEIINYHQQSIKIIQLF